MDAPKDIKDSDPGDSRKDWKGEILVEDELHHDGEIIDVDNGAALAYEAKLEANSSS